MGGGGRERQRGREFMQSAPHGRVAQNPANEIFSFYDDNNNNNNNNNKILYSRF